MKSIVSKSDFRDAFIKMGRKDNFSYNGLGALYDFLTEIEEDGGQEMELDVIAICCDYSEYSSKEDAAKEYSVEPEELSDNTTVIEFDGGVIVQNY